MLGYDAIDSMLFGGNEEGREATFNLPNKVNNMLRKYDRNFDPAELSRKAGRKHTFDAPPRRLRILPQWDWVTHHCTEKDDWIDSIRAMMVGQPSDTKWLIHGYEVCGLGQIKRPMLEMLREGLNHHDRIPHPMDNTAPAPLAASGWVRHIVAHYNKLPDIVFFTPSIVPKTSRVFDASGRASIGAVMRDSPEFGMWGSRVVDMPAAMHTSFCDVMWPLIQTTERQSGGKARKRSCPERVVTMAEPLMFVSKRRILSTPKETWAQVLRLLDNKDTKAANDELIKFAWHMLFGQAAVLQPRFMHEH